MAGQYIPALTGMRGIAAFLVLAFHIRAFYADLNGRWPLGGPGIVSQYGWIGVDFFFVLSGFLLAIPFYRRPRDTRGLGFYQRFLQRRFVRLAPPYYAAILLTLVLVGRDNPSGASAWDIISHVLYIHNLDMNTHTSLVGVFWTLGIEFQFYLLLPLLMLGFTSARWRWLLAGMVALNLAWTSVVFDWPSPRTSGWLSTQVLAFLIHFAAGIVAARAYTSGWRPRYSADMTALVALTTLVAFPLVLTQGVDRTAWIIDRQTAVFIRVTIGVGFAFLILLLLDPVSRVGRALASAPLQALGKMSYSLYLVHLPVLHVAIPYASFMQGWSFTAYLGAQSAIAMVAAAALYWTVERPTLRRLERTSASWTTTAPSSAPRSTPSPAADDHPQGV